MDTEFLRRLGLENVKKTSVLFGWSTAKSLSTRNSSTAPAEVFFFKVLA